MSDGQPVEGSLYFYAPNKGATIFFTIAFAATSFVHFYQCFHYTAIKITGLLPLTCLLFAAGYALRSYNAFDFGHRDIYITSTILIYMCPPLFELANFHILGRILYYVPYCSPLHPGRTFTTFAMIAFVVEILNGIGVAWLVNPEVDPDLQTTGGNLIKASLILQLVVVTLFVGVVAWFQVKCRSHGISSKAITAPCLTMYATSVLVLIRCIYRTVEHFGIESLQHSAVSDVNDISPLIRYEWYFYVFEAIPMILFPVVWNIRHPRMYLPQNFRVYLAQDGVTEIEGPGWEDNRGVFWTLVDPFGCIKSSQKGGEKPFWESNGYAQPSSSRV